MRQENYPAREHVKSHWPQLDIWKGLIVRCHVESIGPLGRPWFPGKSISISNPLLGSWHTDSTHYINLINIWARALAMSVVGKALFGSGA